MTPNLVYQADDQHNRPADPQRIWGVTNYARFRFRERFGGEFTAELVAQFRKLILSGACKRIAGSEESRAIYFCHWTAKNVEVPVVYDAWTDVIVTVLPRASVQVVA